jgi:hypothetical protein
MEIGEEKPPPSLPRFLRKQGRRTTNPVETGEEDYENMGGI